MIKLPPGRLLEAVENLEDWLMKVEPELSDLKQIDGDVYTVQNLIEQHRFGSIFVYFGLLSYAFILNLVTDHF